MSRLRRRRNAANASKNTSTMVFTIAVRLPHNTFRPNFDSNSLALFDCCMGSKEKNEPLSLVCLRRRSFSAADACNNLPFGRNFEFDDDAYTDGILRM